MDNRLPRRLAAILYADVAGYSRLTGEDEDGTHQTLRNHLDLMATGIETWNGRVVHYAGDAVLAEFGAAADALASAICIQTELGKRNAELPEQRRLQFRIGVNLGDVIPDRGDIYGDGVNVAARLEGLAVPGGVCVSAVVREAVGETLPLLFEDLGPRTVKNIVEPVHAFQVRLKEGAAPPPPRTRRRLRRPLATLLLALLLAGLVLFAWQGPWAPPASPKQSAAPAPRPAIVVLPFSDLSSDPQQAHFAEGMTEDLITELSAISSLRVIARNAALEDRAGDPLQAALELGAGHLLRGSVRRAGDTIRINTQLIDASDGSQLWGERYDGKADAVFALQDRVVKRIVAALSVELTDAEQDRLERIPTHSLEAYDYFLRAGRALRADDLNGRRNALAWYRTAIALDPDFARAHAGLALTATRIWRRDDADLMPAPVARKLAYEAASRALDLDPETGEAYAVLAYAQLVDSRHDDALDAIRRAVALRPGDPDLYLDLARILVYSGRHEEALQAVDEAFNLEPSPPPDYHGDRGWVLFWNHQPAEALEPLRTAIAAGVDRYTTLAMSYAELGMRDEARTAVAQALAQSPETNLAYYRLLHAHFRNPADLERGLAALRRAGMPEWPLGYQGRPEDRLDAETVAALTFGRTWVGQDADGQPFIQETGDDGSVALRSSDSLLIGTAWMEGSLLCNHFPAIRMARRSCGYLLFRNPTGTAERQNEYVEVSAGGILYFSVLPE